MKKTISTDIVDGMLRDLTKLRLGHTIRFVPYAFYQEISAVMHNGTSVHRGIRGTICFIHWKHRYFTVRYEMQGISFLESFKF